MDSEACVQRPHVSICLAVPPGIDFTPRWASTSRSPTCILPPTCTPEQAKCLTMKFLTSYTSHHDTILPGNLFASAAAIKIVTNSVILNPTPPQINKREKKKEIWGWTTTNKKKIFKSNNTLYIKKKLLYISDLLISPCSRCPHWLGGIIRVTQSHNHANYGSEVDTALQYFIWESVIANPFDLCNFV